jgi:hypothetical protein
MSKYVKDGTLKFLTVTEENLDTIQHFLKTTLETTNKQISEQHGYTDFQKEAKTCRLQYFLREDNVGVKYFVYDEFKKTFHDSNKIERVVIELFTLENVQSHAGKHIFIKFDINKGASQYTVEDDEQIWVSGIAEKLGKIFNEQKNHYHIFHSWYTAFLFQVIGVFSIFLLCLWLSKWCAGHLIVDNPFLFSFIGLFLLFSNIDLPPFIQPQYS